MIGNVSDFVLFLLLCMSDAVFSPHSLLSAALETEESGTPFSGSKKDAEAGLCCSREHLNVQQKFLKHRTKIITLF